jgi:6-phosphogluconate dehydrogenase
MRIGMVGLGRMGANMVRRLLRAGHQAAVYDRSQEAVAELAAEGATGCGTLVDLVAALAPPRDVFVMVPAAVVDGVIDELEPLLARGDTIVDGGNSHYPDDLARAARLAPRGVHYLDVGTSGGVHGLERGYCLMIGGDPEPVARLEPVFRALAPGRGDVPPSRGREERGGTAEEGFLHCGPVGAGHFVKMVHNGIEYGMMAAYAEGFNVLRRAGIGKLERAADAGTAPLARPELYRYDLDLADIAELWRRGSVVTSWLLDLTAEALAADPELAEFSGRVADSGEGRWTVQAAIDEGVPAHVLTAALYERFASRGLDRFQNQVLSAMRKGFGGHGEARRGPRR